MNIVRRYEREEQLSGGTVHTTLAIYLFFPVTDLLYNYILSGYLVAALPAAANRHMASALRVWPRQGIAKREAELDS